MAKRIQAKKSPEKSPESLLVEGAQRLKEALEAKQRLDEAQREKERATNRLSYSKVPDAESVLNGISCFRSDLNPGPAINTFISTNSDHIPGFVASVRNLPGSLIGLTIRACLNNAKNKDDAAKVAVVASEILTEHIQQHENEDDALRYLDAFIRASQKPTAVAVQSMVGRNHPLVARKLVKMGVMTPDLVNWAIKSALGRSLANTLQIATAASSIPGLLKEVDLMSLVPGENQRSEGRDFIEVVKSGCDIRNRDAAIEAYAGVIVKDEDVYAIVEFARAFPNVRKKEVREAITRAVSSPPIEDLVDAMISGRSPRMRRYPMHPMMMFSPPFFIR